MPWFCQEVRSAMLVASAMALKILVFTLMVILSVAVSVGLLVLMGVVRAEDFVTLLPQDSLLRETLPKDVQFRAEQIENASRMQQNATQTQQEL